MGSVTPQMEFSPALRVLTVSVAGNDPHRWKSLAGYLQTGPQLERLNVCCSVKTHLAAALNDLQVPVLDFGEKLVTKSNPIHPSMVFPLPEPSDRPPILYLVDVGDKELDSAAQLAKALQPTTGKKCFEYMLFPRFNITLDRGVEGLLHALSLYGVKIATYLYLPSSCRPVSEEEKERIKKLEYVVRWGGGFPNIDKF